MSKTKKVDWKTVANTYKQSRDAALDANADSVQYARGLKAQIDGLKGTLAEARKELSMASSAVESLEERLARARQALGHLAREYAIESNTDEGG